jgi:hypothetical protein
MSSRAAQPNDWQLRMPVEVFDFHNEPSTGLAGDEGVRPGTGRTTRATAGAVQHATPMAGKRVK